MKGLTFFVATVLMAGIPGFSPDKLSQLLKKAETARISAEYNCTFKRNEVPVELKGKALLQGNCFTLKGNGIEIYCDGKVLVYVDPAAKEAYIEEASRLTDYIGENAKDVENLEISNVSTSAFSDILDVFGFDVSALDKTWVVTDLR